MLLALLPEANGTGVVRILLLPLFIQSYKGACTFCLLLENAATMVIDSLRYIIVKLAALFTASL